MKKILWHEMSGDGKTKLNIVGWAPDKGETKAVIQIAHGVTEHMGRYEEFARVMTSRGIAVVGNDCLGHGKSVSQGSAPMYFGSWDYIVMDLLTVSVVIRRRFPDVPIHLLGFSLGSFAVRTLLCQVSSVRYAKEFGTSKVYASAILVGTGQQSGVEIAIAKMIANSECRKHGEDVASDKITKMAFDNYNKYFKPNSTRFDWLMVDEKSRNDYIKDNMRGDQLTPGLFRELLNGMDFCRNQKHVLEMDKDIPILLVSGSRDPVGGFGKGVSRVVQSFKKAGIEVVDCVMIDDLRHDVIHDNYDGCREKVESLIIDWVSNEGRRK